MKIKQPFISAVVLLLSFFSYSLFAQEGHPLKGTWRGEINMGNESQPLLIIMDYEDDTITGLVNPGRSSYRFTRAELDASNWLLVAEATDREGVPVRLEATLQEVGARNRYLEGTWIQGVRAYPFRITRE